MKKLITPLLAMALATIFSLSVKAQNLVPNGSFEQYYSCPVDLNEVDSCIGWRDVLNSPDYLNKCSATISHVSIPDNFAGHQFPFDGNAYAGLFTFVANQPNYREIIGTQLIGILIPGNTYHVSMRTSRGANRITASNKIGMRLTTYDCTLSTPPSINNYSQIYTDSIVVDTLNWVLLEWDYVADSAYKYLFIGNFFTDANTDTVNFGTSLLSPAAYYYIDSVSVYCNNNGDGNICYNAIFPIENAGDNIEYNSNKHSIYLKSSIDEEGRLSIFNSTGQRVKQLNVNNNETVNLSDLSNGFYIALFQTKEIALSKK